MPLPAGPRPPAAPLAPSQSPSQPASPLPWAQRRAGLLDGVGGILTDIDDTLTREGEIEPEALAALHALAAAGLPVIAITGRPAGWSEPRLRAWPLLAVAAENGGVLLQPPAGDARADAPLRISYTVDDATRAANYTRLQACAADILARLPQARLALDSPGRLTDIAIDHSEHHHLAAADIARVVALMQAHGLVATVSSIHINGWIGT
ncbi:MAG: hypothetical protein RL722_2682, partial [Pseudomonadota bacterium]